VCVRHNNDCQAVCVPRVADPKKKTVCSKGCNRMLRVSKAKPSDGFDIVVCQVDHRIVCEPWRKGSKQSASPCKTEKWVKPVARYIDFDADVWNVGATCIANHAHKEKHMNCPELTAATTKKLQKSRKATEADSAACGPLAKALAEYY